MKPTSSFHRALLALAFLVVVGSPAAARADAVKPRFVIVVDTSGSMTESAATRARTHGDGSQTHPGCDLDDNGRFDDSKLYQAKAALNDTIAAFGSAEFSLAKYRQRELGQACPGGFGDCDASLADTCTAGHCAFTPSPATTDYNECSGGTATGNGCIRCADPANDPTSIFYNGQACCTGDDPRANGLGIASDVVVAFPAQGGTNYAELLSWMDGVEDFPVGTNRELRATGVTPIGGALNGVRDWLVADASGAGPGSGVLNRDPLVDCRSYNVILITDGIETASCTTNCGVNGALAAEQLSHACTHGGLWDPIDNRCERAGSPDGTRQVRVRTYVVGFTVNDASLNSIAAAGGTATALLANNQAELTARLGDIIAGSIPVERCDCKDNTCDGAVDETFPTKGETCSVGIGRCKRAGAFGCSADGTGVVCTAGAAGTCPATPLVAGAPTTEQCGAAPGCLAPTPEDCADDDCDGLIDEDLSCDCTARPEVCNGLDDDCNGRIDDVTSVYCGLMIGECRPGITLCMDDGNGGKAARCVGAIGRVPEVCDGKDNDCDGITDGFGTPCYPTDDGGCYPLSRDAYCPSTASEWSCQGICATGLATCSSGKCGACQGAVTPGPELACDGLDNDCDGKTDEGFGIGEGCGPGVGGVGECRPGVLRCDGTALVCEGGRGPADEVCNDKDDDCNGATDDLPGTCGITGGACVPGKWKCAGGQPVCDQPLGPTAELCNGVDDDCDGKTDEDPTDPDLVTPTACGSELGICKVGVVKCIGGVKACEGGVESVRETCNGLDDDCNGKTDDAINSAGMCPPPGLPVGTMPQGECRPGMNVCAPDGAGGAMWTCQGGTGPAPEACDGKDNDCNGAIDDGATCPPDQGCAFGECVPRCRPGEFVCPEARVCIDGLCVQNECVRTPCGAGFSCDPKRGCVDRCEGVICPEGLRCVDGGCTGCFATGCAAGQICRGTECEADPCGNVACAGQTYCRVGACTRRCADVTCPSGQRCELGACVANACTNKSCGRNQVCNPATGACQPDRCAAIHCLPGHVCVALTEMCIPDPCTATQCKGDDVCVVRPDGQPECVLPSTLAENQPTRVSLGGSGCSCTVGAARANGGAAGLLAALAFVVVGARRVRRGGRR